MARVRAFREVGDSSRRGFRTEVDCGYARVAQGGVSYLLLETYGGEDRVRVGQVNQALHLDESACRELKRIIERVFPEKRE